MQLLKLEGFLNMPFGSEKEFVLDSLKKRGGIVEEEISTNESVFFSGIKFAGHNTDTVLISFFDNQFAKASVYIKPPLESKAISLYEGIVKDLNSKYFITSDSFETYDFPYEKNDGYTETAISLGKAEFSSFWKFSNSNKIDDFLSVRIDEGLDIVVTYEHGDLTQKFVDRIKEDQSLDY